MNETELTQELVRINSENPPGNEKEVANYVKDFLDGLQLPVEMIKFGENRYNIVSKIGKGNGLMLNAHLDTVPAGTLENWKYDPFEAKITNGRIFGRGAS